MPRKHAGLATAGLALILILELSFISVPTTSSPRANGDRTLKWLHVDGRSFRDSDGQEIVLRGVNIFGYEVSPKALRNYGNATIDSIYSEDDYAAIAGYGFNVVRLPIAWHWIEPDPGFYDSSYIHVIHKNIQWAGKYGVYVLLDMHQFEWSPWFYWNYGEGMPTWLVNGYSNDESDLQQAQIDFWLGKGPNGTVASDTNPSMQERFVAMWKYVAQQFPNESTVIGYDLFNEPFVDDKRLLGNFSTSEMNDMLFPLYSSLARAIRAVDTRRIIFYEGWTIHVDAEKMRIPLQVQSLNETNIALDVHFYGLRTFYDGNPSDLQYNFETYYLHPGQEIGVPILIGEFGTRIEYPNATQWLHDLLNLMERNGLSWNYWCYGRSDQDTMFLFCEDGTPRSEWLRYLRG